MTERERLIEILNKYFEVGDSDFYICNRVKEAFALGTMSLDDFSELDGENTADIADYLLENGVIVPICKVGDTVYILAGHNGRKYEKDTCEGFYIGYDGVVQVRVRNMKGNHGTYGVMGKTVFLTSEDAEKALKERERK